MPTQSLLGNAIIFFEKIGIYDVVLPFLLVFTLVFAILEKTKVLGTEKVEGETTTKKNLNAMAAFVIALMTIASSRLVEAITSISSQAVLLFILAFFFLALVGTALKEGEIGAEGLKNNWQRNAFITVMLIGILIIFFNSIKTETGESWLDYSLSYITSYWNSTAFASIILIAGIIGFIAYITSSEGSGGGKK